MTIRRATRDDLPKLKQCLVRYSRISPIPELRIGELSDDDKDIHAHANQTLLNLLLSGIIFVDERDDEFIGMIMGMKAKHFFNVRYTMMNLVCFWVEPEHRRGSSAFRLFSEYKNYCEQLVAEKKINHFTMTNNVYTSDTLSYERYGMNKLETTWISEGTL